MNLPAEIDERHLSVLIPRFYAKVREDSLIGPIFDGAIVNRHEHLAKLVSFWPSVMLSSGHYKGNPVAAHRKHLSAIAPVMFDRWLTPWAEVTDEMLPVSTAAALQCKASRIAESLKLAFYFRLPPRRRPRTAGSSPSPLPLYSTSGRGRPRAARKIASLSCTNRPRAGRIAR